MSAWGWAGSTPAKHSRALLGRAVHDGMAFRLRIQHGPLEKAAVVRGAVGMAEELSEAPRNGRAPSTSAVEDDALAPA